MLQIWNVSGASKIEVPHRITGSSSKIRRIVFSPDGQDIFTLGDGRIDVRGMQTVELTILLHTHSLSFFFLPVVED